MSLAIGIVLCAFTSFCIGFGLKQDYLKHRVKELEQENKVLELALYRLITPSPDESDKEFRSLLKD